MLPPALLPPFLASYGVRLLAAFSTFRFCASGGASGSGSLVFCVIRVIRVPVFCFWSCFWKRVPRYPRYPRSGFLLLVVLLEAFSAFSALSASRLRDVIVVVRVLLAYGDNVRSGGGSGGPKMALL